MMNNLMGGNGRQGFYQDDNSRLGLGVSPFSSSSSPTPSAAASPSLLEQQQHHDHHHHQIGFHSSYYSYQQQQQPQPQPRGPRDIEIMRGYGGGGRATNTSTSSQHQLHMMISVDGSSSSPSSSNNNNTISISEEADHHQGGVGEVSIEREHMFDKVVTPSDVGKLNRLVIPKQHAEKYFPLDSSTNEKGLLLNFEDRNGKPWRFRYSYWNSSQSYVMTKGWSRFVKEKKLDAGDVVSFQRGLGDLGKDRLFIDWRRRPDVPSPSPYPPIPTLSLPNSSHHPFSSFPYPWIDHHPVPYPNYLQQQQLSSSSRYSHFQQYNNNYYESHLDRGYGGYGSRNPCSGSIIYLNNRSAAGTGVGMGNRGIRGMDEAMVFESVPVVQGKAAAKRLRLFGVNMDCPISEEEDSTTSDHHHPEIFMNQQQQYCRDILPSTAVPFSSTTSAMASAHSLPRPSDSFLNKGKAAASNSMSLDLDI